MFFLMFDEFHRYSLSSMALLGRIFQLVYVITDISAQELVEYDEYVLLLHDTEKRGTAGYLDTRIVHRAHRVNPQLMVVYQGLS